MIQNLPMMSCIVLFSRYRRFDKLSWAKKRLIIRARATTRYHHQPPSRSGDDDRLIYYCSRTSAPLSNLLLQRCMSMVPMMMMQSPSSFTELHAYIIAPLTSYVWWHGWQSPIFGPSPIGIRDALTDRSLRGFYSWHIVGSHL